MGLKVDSYYLDCLQTIRRLSDAFVGDMIPLDEEFFMKTIKLMVELDVELDDTSFENPDHLIDDLLNALITMRNAYSPDTTSDLSREFDFSIGQYFPEMPCVRLEQGINDWKKAV